MVHVLQTFLEMLTPEEAASMVKYYQRTTPMVRGHAIQVYLSSAIKTIQVLLFFFTFTETMYLICCAFVCVQG